MASCNKSSIKYSRNKFSDFLPPVNINFFFINPNNKIEIKNIILSLDPLKSIGPNSIPTKILKLLGDDISTQFAAFFNLSFSEGVFPSTCKFIKRIHNLLAPSIGQSIYCQTLIKFLKGLCIIACINF